MGTNPEFRAHDLLGGRDAWALVTENLAFIETVRGFVEAGAATAVIRVDDETKELVVEITGLVQVDKFQWN